MDFWTVIGSIPEPVLILLLIIFVILTVYIIYENAKMKGLEGIRAQVYQYMLKAEHIYVSSEGRQKLKYVVHNARMLLPDWLRFFISDEALMNLCDAWFKEVKDLLDDGKINSSAQLNKESEEVE
jgi:hypothetical protein